MRVLYHIPSLDTVYAGRTIYFGYKHAFEDLGHNFRTLTAGDDQQEVFEAYNPHIFISSLSNYSLKFLDTPAFNTARRKGMRAFMSTHAWVSPLAKIRINEPISLRDQKEKVLKIQRRELGDVFFNPFEQGDERMAGFEKETGFKHTTILLAADKLIHFPEFTEKFKAEVSFIGTYLPEKRKFIEEYVHPLRKEYIVKLYGQDWTHKDRSLGVIHKAGQYFDIPILRTLQKTKLAIEDERRIYSSTTVSINIHEEYQRRFGGDCNERTFKIPLSGGFEITDDVACIRKYFIDGKEIVIAKNKDDWFEKIRYYINKPEKRLPIINAGRKKVSEHHTYHNRVKQIIDIYSTIKKS